MFVFKLLPFFLALFGVLAFAAPSLAADAFPGLYQAKVMRVIDGDTLEVAYDLAPEIHTTQKARLLDIDAPERASRKKYPERHARFQRSKERMTELAGEEVILRNVCEGTYRRRILADVYAADGWNIGKILLDEGLAKPYEGRNTCKRAHPVLDRLPPEFRIIQEESLP